MHRKCWCFLVLQIYVVMRGVSSTNFKRLPEPAALQRQFERSTRQIPNPKVYRCGDIGSELVVNFVNTNYPNDDTVPGDCKFKMVLSGHSTCQIRVDFVDTELMEPVRGECLSQFFIVQGEVWPTGLPPLCGINTDQHFYLHLEPWYSNATVVEFNLVTVVRGRPYRFGVWLTQIDCSAANVLKAPEGCTQYFLAENGTIKSFNYEGFRYLNSQNYQVCIRPVRGVCGIQYEAAHGDFAMKKSIVASREIMQRSGVGSAICGADYILIVEGRESLFNVRRARLLFNRRRRPAAPPTPAPAPPRKRQEVVPSADRFCGTHFSPAGGEHSSRPVFARVKSNMVFLRVKTTPLQEDKGSSEALNLTAGFRITYKQIKNCGYSDSDLVIPHSVQAILETLKWGNGGAVSVREPASSESLILSAPGKNDTFQTTERMLNTTDDIPENDEMWDYLDQRDDADGSDKDLYDF